MIFSGNSKGGVGGKDKGRGLFWFGWIVLFLFLWEIGIRIFPVSPLLIPSPVMVAESLIAEAASGKLLQQTLFSLAVIGQGIALGILGAFLLMLLGSLSRATEELINLLCAVLHPLPGVALLPLVILWFGTGTLSVVVIIVHAVLWPLVVNLKTGFVSLPETYRNVGRNYGLTGAGLAFHILFPASLSFLLAGIKTAWARAWRALISAEMIFGALGGLGGLGWFLFQKRVFMDSAALFGGILVIALVGMVIEGILFPCLERLTIHRWGMMR